MSGIDRHPVYGPADLAEFDPERLLARRGADIRHGLTAIYVRNPTGRMLVPAATIDAQPEARPLTSEM